MLNESAQAVADVGAAAPGMVNNATQAIAQTVKTKPGFLAKLKDMFNPTKIAERLHLSTDMIKDMALYLGVGFLVGFILKRFSVYVFILTLGIIGLVALQQIGVISITVSWAKMHQIFGIQPAAIVDSSVLATYWDWVKVNMALVLSFSVGFLIGLRLG